MKKLFALVLAAASVTAGGANANGSPYSPGLVYGWSGVGAPDSGVRFVAFGMPKSTIVAAVRARDGHVLRSTTVRGFYGVPLVSYDGTSGGLSGDGKSLALASYGPYPGQKGETRFVVLGTATLDVLRRVVLPGSWSFDAISPDTSMLYLVEHVSAGQSPRYRVRSYDVRANRLIPGAIVDRLEHESVMDGQPVTRATSTDGRWAYTLYARQKHEPFVHALDTVRREAFCIDLPLRLGLPRQMELRLRLMRDGSSLSVVRDRRPLAVVDTTSWKVERR
jgi:hypothetical protein